VKNGIELGTQNINGQPIRFPQLQGVIFPNLAAINNNAGMGGMAKRAKVIDFCPRLRGFGFFLLDRGNLLLVLPVRRVK